MRQVSKNWIGVRAFKIERTLWQVLHKCRTHFKIDRISALPININSSHRKPRLHADWKIGVCVYQPPNHCSIPWWDYHDTACSIGYPLAVASLTWPIVHADLKTIQSELDPVKHYQIHNFEFLQLSDTIWSVSHTNLPNRQLWILATL